MARRYEVDDREGYLPYGGERGYPAFFLNLRAGWLISAGVTIVIAVVAWFIYTWYAQHSNDPAPDSPLGYIYATIGSGLMIFALLGFSKRRRSSQRVVGQLNKTLNLHMFAGVLSLAFLAMHSFGNLNPRSGTYALYGMIAMAISGFIGRWLDQLMPRLIAKEVDKALTAQGDDQIESITQRLQAIVQYNTRETRDLQRETMNGRQRGGSPVSMVGGTPWDLAYISLDSTPQELDRDASYRFVPDRRSGLTRPGGLMPGAREEMEALEDVQKALQREQFFRYVIRYWRVMHIGLALLTIGLTVWHLAYAATLLMPMVIH